MRNEKRLDLVHEKALAVLRRGGARSATKHVEGESTFDNVNNDKRRLQENYLIWFHLSSLTKRRYFLGA